MSATKPLREAHYWASSVVHAAGMVLVSLSHQMAVTLGALMVVGVAWIGVIATINGVVQSFLPGWVRARGLSVYQVALLGCTALAGAVLLVRPLLATVDRDRSVVAVPLTDLPTFSADPGTERGDLGGRPAAASTTMDDGDLADQMTPAPGAGRTLVLVRFTVPQSRRAEFIVHRRLVERSRRRTGARDWQPHTDWEHPAALVEAFTLGSWWENLSRHESRHTGDDAATT